MKYTHNTRHVAAERPRERRYRFSPRPDLFPEKHPNWTFLPTCSGGFFEMGAKPQPLHRNDAHGFSLINLPFVRARYVEIAH
jgi:hypothetical protein